MSYEYFDHTADIGFDVKAETVERLFEDAASGMLDILGAKNVRQQEVRSITLEPAPLDLLLVDWLREVLAQFDSERFVPEKTTVETVNEESGVIGSVHGEPYESERHQPETEIKAVTYHDLSVEETGNGWRARVIFDL